MLKHYRERTKHETQSLLHMEASGTVQLKAKKLNVPVNVHT